MPVIRVVLYGIYVPYTFGFFASFVVVRGLWQFIGITMGMIGLICAALNLVILAILQLLQEHLSVEQNRTKEVILVIVTALPIIYPLLYCVAKPRVKSGAAIAHV